MTGAPLFNAADAARTLGITSARVRALAVSRKVGTKVGRDWIFTLQDIEAMRERKPGRPKK